jgi:hypothetical protein
MSIATDYPQALDILLEDIDTTKIGDLILHALPGVAQVRVTHEIQAWVHADRGISRYYVVQVAIDTRKGQLYHSATFGMQSRRPDVSDLLAQLDAVMEQAFAKSCGCEKCGDTHGWPTYAELAARILEAVHAR